MLHVQYSALLSSSPLLSDGEVGDSCSAFQIRRSGELSSSLSKCLHLTFRFPQEIAPIYLKSYKAHCQGAYAGNMSHG